MNPFVSLSGVLAEKRGNSFLVYMLRKSKAFACTKGGESRFSPFGNPHRVKSAGTAVSLLLFVLFTSSVYAQIYEINASPFATHDAPLPRMLQTLEKAIVVYPADHLWGAYNEKGKLIRWGIATSGAKRCPGDTISCLTQVGVFRIYSLGNENCASNKYDDGSMPYCMYFNGGQAIHGSADVRFDNVSHGCVRLHMDDAKWLRYHFVQAPSGRNSYQGTKVIIKSY